VLHDGHRTLRATELRAQAIRASPATHHASEAQLSLLAERGRLLRRYVERIAAHGQDWPPPAATDGHHPYPARGNSTPATQPSAPCVPLNRERC